MKLIWKIIAGLLITLFLLVGISALSNLNLPERSGTIVRLSELDKARLSEFFHLRQEIGETVWTGWGESEIPVILHNEEYAFLVGYPGEPPAGWVMMPSGEQRGGRWQIVPDDTFQGEPYYRQPLTDKNATPENFTVLVGEHWAATLWTKEYAKIAFYQGFKEELPGLIRPIVPYRLLWKGLMGTTESYIEAIAHESFHSFQGITVPERLEDAERVSRLEDSYPWENKEVQQAWKTELDLLYQAVTTESDAQAVELAQQFLAQRTARRQYPDVTSQMVNYERNREWLEGLAKYSEISIGLQAANSEDYQPVAAIGEDPAFKAYDTQERFFSQQMAEVKRQSGNQGETRFYYSGMAQAFLLDRLAPEWKANIWNDGVYLEDILSGVLKTEIGG
jgi:hypothetical protein